MRFALILCTSATLASAFVNPTAPVRCTRLMAEKENDNVLPKVSAATASLWVASTQIATAAGPDWGLFEVRSRVRS